MPTFPFTFPAVFEQVDPNAAFVPPIRDAPGWQPGGLTIGLGNGFSSNLINNSDFGTDVAQWTAASGSFTRDSVEGFAGAGSLKFTSVTTTVATPNVNGTSSYWLEVYEGQEINFLAWSKYSGFNGQIQLYIQKYASDQTTFIGNDLIEEIDEPTTATEDWTLIQGSSTYIVPAGVGYILVFASVTLYAGTVWMDGFVLTTTYGPARGIGACLPMDVHSDVNFNFNNSNTVLTDDFSSSAGWVLSGNTTISGGKLHASTSPASGQAISAAANTFQFANSAVSAELQQIPNPPSGGVSNNLYTALTVVPTVASGDYYIMFYYHNGTSPFLLCREAVNNVLSDTSMAFDAVNHRWFRIRETAGTVYWETSADGTTWTVRRSKALNSRMAIDDNKVQFLSNRAGTDFGGESIWDNFKVETNTGVCRASGAGLAANLSSIDIFNIGFDMADGSGGLGLDMGLTVDLPMTVDMADGSGGDVLVPTLSIVYNSPVTFDHVGDNDRGASSTTPIAISYDHGATPAGTNTLVVLWVWAGGDGTPSFSTPTFRGVSMTQRASVSPNSNNRFSCYTLQGPGSSATNTVALNITRTGGSNLAYMVCAHFYTVYTSFVAATTNSGTSGLSPSISVTGNPSAGERIIVGFASGDNTVNQDITSFTGGTLRGGNNQNAASYIAGDTSADGSSQAFGCTTSNSKPWGAIALRVS